MAATPESRREQEEHLLTIPFRPKDDAEAEQIIKSVEPLGFEIVDDLETGWMTGGTVGERTPEALRRRQEEKDA